MVKNLKKETKMDMLGLREEFEEKGVVGPIRLYDEDVAKKILQEIRMEAVEIERSLHKNDVNYDRHFDISKLSQHIGNEVLVTALREILGRDILCWRTEFFPKFPGSKGTEWHQVANYQYATGVPMLESVEKGYEGPLDVTVWTSFTDATVENGCMRFIPGSHKRVYYDESKSISKGRKESFKSVESETSFFGYDFQEFKVEDSWDPESEETIDMVMKPGECVIFSAKCVHGSRANITKNQTRFAITSRYTPTHVKVYPYEKKFKAHGGEFDLDKSGYGPVLVSGKNEWAHNTVKNRNLLNEEFPNFSL